MRKKNGLKFVTLNALTGIIFFTSILFDFLGGASIALLLLSLIFIYRVRDNDFLLLMSAFIFYCVYSVVIAYYFDFVFIQPPNQGSINYVNLRAGLIGLYLFSFFFNSTIGVFDTRVNGEVMPLENGLIFFALLALLFYVIIFQYDRTISFEYVVRITPIYEYSILIFGGLWLFSGEKIRYKIIILITALIYVLQDLIFGGRVSAVQVGILLGFTLFRTHFKGSILIILFMLGVFLMGVVGAYRQNMDLGNLDSGVVNDVFVNKLLTFETAVYSYYASLSHIGARDYLSVAESFSSLLDFIVYAVTGFQLLGDGIFDVTGYVRDKYFENYGGGVFFSHLYFWGSYPLIILVSIIWGSVFVLIDKVDSKRKRYIFMIFAVATVPRWYLYTPLPGIRILLFLLFSFFVYEKIFKRKI